MKIDRTLNILFCTSEAFPYIKTGGLADMSYSLPQELSQKKHNVSVILPFYSKFISQEDARYLGYAFVFILGRQRMVKYYEKIFQGLRYILVFNEELFGRDYIYGGPDEAERFIFFDYAILESITALNLDVDILHLNDWQTSLVPYILDEQYRQSKPDKYFLIRTLLTIHNLQYQGVYPLECQEMLGKLNDHTYNHFGSFNMLKTGIVRASAINTVSPTYKEEIQTQGFGFSLDGDLYWRKSSLFGILNGIDYQVYNPKTDPNLYKNYQKPYYQKGKQVNKEGLLRDLGLVENLDFPLISFISRLTSQKGVDLVIDVLNDLIECSNANFIIIGSGDRGYEEKLQYLRDQFPTRIYFYKGFEPNLASKTYAGSDLFLMPSLFEPSGLSQMIACHYGTLPIVREVGGLKDSIIPYNEFDLKKGCGFTFAYYDLWDFKNAIYRAINLYKYNKPHFNQLILNAMNKNFSMVKVAKEYISLYNKILKDF
ncbi:MAG: glycogen synthase [Acholeplasmatales bacterium]|jgi:starch synthase|nr:glycogen synthase [Acholeplasmatales bacterium]